MENTKNAFLEAASEIKTQTLESFIHDEENGLDYELVGDYYLLAGDDEPEEEKPMGIWGQRRLRFIKKHRIGLYNELLLSGKLGKYLYDLNNEAEEMLADLVKQLAEKQGITEQLKAENQMEWVGLMNNIQNSAREAVYNDLIYA